MSLISALRSARFFHQSQPKIELRTSPETASTLFTNSGSVGDTVTVVFSAASARAFSPVARPIEIETRQGSLQTDSKPLLIRSTTSSEMAKYFRVGLWCRIVNGRTVPSSEKRMLSRRRTPGLSDLPASRQLPDARFGLPDIGRIHSNLPSVDLLGYQDPSIEAGDQAQARHLNQLAQPAQPICTILV